MSWQIFLYNFRQLNLVWGLIVWASRLRKTVKSSLKNEQKLQLWSLMQIPFVLLHQVSCPWCPFRFSLMSATSQCCTPPKLTSQTSERPGFALEAPGFIHSSGHCRPSWDGAAMDQRAQEPLAPFSGTCAHPPVSRMCCVSSSSAWCYL